jgi:hypothetical protein
MDPGNWATDIAGGWVKVAACAAATVIIGLNLTLLHAIILR